MVNRDVGRLKILTSEFYRQRKQFRTCFTTISFKLARKKKEKNAVALLSKDFGITSVFEKKVVPRVSTCCATRPEYTPPFLVCINRCSVIITNLIATINHWHCENDFELSSFTAARYRIVFSRFRIYNIWRRVMTKLRAEFFFSVLNLKQLFATNRINTIYNL